VDDHIKLPRGCYEYRFVVDGNWVSDPSAKGSAANPFGGSKFGADSLNNGRRGRLGQLRFVLILTNGG